VREWIHRGIIRHGTKRRNFKKTAKQKGEMNKNVLEYEDPKLMRRSAAPRTPHVVISFPGCLGWPRQGPANHTNDGETQKAGLRGHRAVYSYGPQQPTSRFRGRKAPSEETTSDRGPMSSPMWYILCHLGQYIPAVHKSNYIQRNPTQRQVKLAPFLAPIFKRSHCVVDGSMVIHETSPLCKPPN
jgi:hypothetical protein